MPASLPVNPGGRAVSRPVICWVPSARESFKTKGLKAPAAGATVPAEKLGLLGASASDVGQAPEPEAAVVVTKESVGCWSSPSGVDQGVRVEVVVLVPHEIGVFSEA